MSNVDTEVEAEVTNLIEYIKEHPATDAKEICRQFKWSIGRCRERIQRARFRLAKTDGQWISNAWGVGYSLAEDELDKLVELLKAQSRSLSHSATSNTIKNIISEKKLRGALAHRAWGLAVGVQHTLDAARRAHDEMRELLKDPKLNRLVGKIDNETAAPWRKLTPWKPTEDRMAVHRARHYACGICGKRGHNRRGCKA